MESAVLNISPLVVWAVALSQLLTFGLTVYGLLSSGSRANGKRLDEHGERLTAVESRLQHVDQSVTQLPSKEDVHKLQLSLKDLAGDLKAFRAELEGDMKSLRAEYAGMNDLIQRVEHVVDRHENQFQRGSTR